MSENTAPSLLDRCDALLLDLDGTVMHGSLPIPGAADGVQAARDAGRTIVFATNNASRTPAQVVTHLAGVGVTAHEEEIITSPQVAAAMVRDRCAPGSKILIIGSDSLAEQMREAGMTPVRQDSPDTVAVVQGWAADISWAHLAEGAYAIAHGAWWLATNTDATLPTERGMAPGNGSLVTALRHATGTEPDVAGKPEPAMFLEACRARAIQRPLAIGDRLNTDIACAVRAGVDALLVLTGVSSALDALRADPGQRPVWIRADMTALDAPQPTPEVSDGTARCGGVTARWAGETGGDIVIDADQPLNPQQPSPQIAQAALALIRTDLPETAWNGVLRSERDDERAQQS